MDSLGARMLMGRPPRLVLGLRAVSGWVVGLGVFCREPIPLDSLGVFGCERAFRSRQLSSVNASTCERWTSLSMGDAVAGRHHSLSLR